MWSRAAVAASSVVAATAATGSPTKRTLSRASACSSWLTGRIPNGIGRSRPVSTAFTPGTASACDVSIETMRAWGCGLRSSLAYSMRGKNRSSANFVTPVTLAVASTLRSALPTTAKAAVGRSGGRAVRLLPDAIQRLRSWRRWFTAQARRGQFDRFVDLDVAGAAAQVARQCLLDVVSSRLRIGYEQCLGSEQKRRRAVAALRRAELRERVLQRVQPTAGGHSLDRLHTAAGAGEAQHQTRQHRGAVEQHGAGAALSQLAAVLRAREAQVLAQHLEQRFVRREGDFDGLAIELEGDLRLGVGHVSVILISGGGGASFCAQALMAEQRCRRLDG